jgi:predicted O-methyltransferase YrrM
MKSKQQPGLSGVIQHVKSVFGPNRWILATALKHPVKAIAFVRERGDSAILLEGSWVAANKLAKSISHPSNSKREGIREVRELQLYLRETVRSWRELDPSRMSEFKGPLLYFLVRLWKPAVIVETGVASGISSAFILSALRKNRGGLLVSIDLPNINPQARIPEDQRSGWIVPDALRSAWDLSIGDSRILLPQLLQSCGTIDMFLHDSLHTYEHMMWEYKMAWPALSEGGLLLSDDIAFNRAFSDFCDDIGAAALLRYGLGIAIKQTRRSEPLSGPPEKNPPRV